jgi:hypothetical protein
MKDNKVEMLDLGGNTVLDKRVPEFVEFGKIPRLSRDCIVTEKIDGTNAQVYITESGEVYAGSRNRWLTAGKGDNFGFAGWVKEHEEELLGLGQGRHYGEWWGSGIQRGYGLKGGERRFSLFNVSRWLGSEGAREWIGSEGARERVPPPSCCSVVPVLYTGLFGTGMIQTVLGELEHWGSRVMPGFMNPEGVVIFHSAGGYLFKKTLCGDDGPKSVVREG